MNTAPGLNLDRVEITGNGAGVSYTYGSMINISNSTIAENSGTGLSVNFASANVFNTTISGNETAGIAAAGLSTNFGNVTLTNVTITNNRADKNNASGNSSATGGVYAGDSGTITMHNTIVVGNFAGHVSSGVAADLGRASGNNSPFGALSSYNLIGSSPAGAFPTGNNNQLGVSASAVRLTPLDYFGGPTRTHALRENSIAIDAGDNAKTLALELDYDQRGAGFDRIVDWQDDDPIEVVDIGALELAIQEIYT